MATIARKRVFVAGHRGMVGSAIVRQLGNRTDVGPGTVHEAHVSQGNHDSIFVNCFGVSTRGNLASLRGNKLNLCAARLLGQPDLPHRGKFEFAHDDLPPLSVEIQCARDRADTV